MKKLILLIVAILSYASHLMACDSCNMYEYNPTQTKSFIGVFYNYTLMKGYHNLPSINGPLINNGRRTTSNAHLGATHSNKFILPNQNDFEQFQTIELRYNQTIKDKYNLLISIPFQRNSTYFKEVWSDDSPVEDSSFVASGLGDILISLQRINQTGTPHLMHTLKYGFAVSLPTSKVNFEAAKDDVTHYPGRGVITPMARISHTMKINLTWGLRTFLNYSKGFSLESEDKTLSYQYGDRLNAGSSFFYSLKQAEWRITPSLGTYYELYSSDRYNNESLENNASTFFGTTGLSISHINSIFRFQIQVPLIESTGDSQLKRATRANVILIQQF